MKKSLLLSTALFLFISGSAQEWNYYGAQSIANGNAPSMEIDPQGVPYVAYADVSGKIRVSKYNGTAWVAVGEAISIGDSFEPSIAMDAQGTPYVAYNDGSPTRKANVKKFNGTSWEFVGAAEFSSGSASFLTVEIAADGVTPYVCFRDNVNSGKAAVMKYNGSSWEFVGSAAITSTAVAYPNIAFAPDGTLYMAYQAEFGNASVMKYSGGTWAVIGQAGFTSGSFIDIEINPAGVPYTASMMDSPSGGKGIVTKFNGSSWETVGTAGFSTGMARRINMVFDETTPYIVYQNYISDINAGSDIKIVVKKFDDTSWITLGTTPLMSSTENGDYPSLKIDGNGIPYIAFNNQDQEIRVIKYSCSPSPPANATTPAQSTICPETKATLSVTTAEGNTVNWYDQQFGGAVLGLGLSFVTEKLAGAKTYYAAAINSCGVSTRTAVPVALLSASQIAIEGNISICKGEGTTLHAIGGTTYQWQGGPASANYFVKPENTATYTVTGTNANGCSNSFAVTVTVKELPDIEIAGNRQVCPGENTTLTATGAKTFQWRNGPATAIYSFVPPATAIYRVSGTGSNGCTGADSVTVTVTSPNVNVWTDANKLIAEASPATYQWINCDLNALVMGATEKTFTPTASGNYAVRISQNLCVATSACKLVVITSTEEAEATRFEVYPNPSQGFFHVKARRNGTFKVMDQLGRMLRALPAESIEGVEVNGLPDGLYYIFFTDTDGKSLGYKRVVVQKGQ